MVRSHFLSLGISLQYLDFYGYRSHFLSLGISLQYLEFSLGAQVEYICTYKQKIYEKLPTTHDSLLFKAYANCYYICN